GIELLQTNGRRRMAWKHWRDADGETRIGRRAGRHARRKIDPPHEPRQVTAHLQLIDGVTVELDRQDSGLRVRRQIAAADHDASRPSAAAEERLRGLEVRAGLVLVGHPGDFWRERPSAAQHPAWILDRPPIETVQARAADELADFRSKHVVSALPARSWI